jgi:hypothetical protein
MKHRSFLAFVCLFASASSLPGGTLWQWQEYAANPVFAPSGDRAYYPTLVKESDTSYKMWYDASSNGPHYATSSDGIHWSAGNGGNPVSGTTSARHSVVRYSNADHKYRMWYWDSSQLYSIASIRYAESTDGLTWTNDQSVTQDSTKKLVTGSSGDWNRGSYGPSEVILNTVATNSGTNPWDYSYVMYYDATTGGEQSIGLGYSSDGIHWIRYGAANADGEVLAPATGAWDATHVGRSTVWQESDSSFHMWYSGGDGRMNHGIGYATSTDGLQWTRDTMHSPIFSKSDGVSWRSERTYTPAVIGDEMWFSGKDGSGNYTIGYATAVPEPASAAVLLLVLAAAGAGVRSRHGRRTATN